MTDLATAPSTAPMEVLDEGHALQRVQTPYSGAVAVQKPRVLATVERLALEEAALLGEEAFYGWGAGKNRIEGPSIDLALVLARVWGNCVTTMQPVQESRDAWIFTAAFVDLETGSVIERQFRQSKRWTVHGKFDDARKDDIRFQIGQSKALRNVIIKGGVPSWLTRRALDKAKGGVREKIEKAINNHGLEAVQARAIERLGELGVTKADVLRVFGRATDKALTVEDLVILHGNIYALETGTDTIDTMFPPEQAPGRERGELNPDDLKPGDEPNRGHDQEELDKVAKPKGKPKPKPDPGPMPLTCPKCKAGTTWLVGPNCPDCETPGVPAPAKQEAAK